MSESALFNLQVVVAAIAVFLIASFLHSFSNERKAMELQMKEAREAAVNAPVPRENTSRVKALDTDPAAPMSSWPPEEAMFALVAIDEDVAFVFPAEIAKFCTNKTDFARAKQKGFQVHGPWHAMQALGTTPGIKEVLCERVAAPPTFIS